MCCVCVSDLLIDFSSSQSRVLQVGSAAVGVTDAAAGRNPPNREVHTAEPAGVVIHSTAVELHRERSTDC